MIKGYIVSFISFILRPAKRILLRLSLGFRGQLGLEIGGPSAFFRPKAYFPVYFLAKRIDGVNFSTQTVWEGTITGGNTYRYFPGKTGFQYIDEASDLKSIGNGAYDFVLSCHSLEHVANPIRALKEWNRVLKMGGRLVLVLPDRNHTFDHRRNYTSFEHLLADYTNNVDEHDDTHLEEIMAFHDISMDTEVTTAQELKARMMQNYTNRCMHHHVFSLELVKQLLTYCGFTVIHQQELAPLHLVTVARKTSA